jgi:hypothetical protein
VRRRDVLLAGAALVVVAAAGAVARFVGWRGTTAPEPPVRLTALPAGSEPLLLAAAEVLVPRHGGHPAASEIDLLPRLDRWVASSPSRARFYRRRWPAFEEEVRMRLRYEQGRPDPRKLRALFQQWYREYRRERPGEAARFFEQLRRDVLRAYYSSPAGWASVAYAGPVTRPHPSAESLP